MKLIIVAMLWSKFLVTKLPSDTNVYIARNPFKQILLLKQLLFKWYLYSVASVITNGIVVKTLCHQQRVSNLFCLRILLSL